MTAAQLQELGDHWQRLENIADAAVFLTQHSDGSAEQNAALTVLSDAIANTAQRLRALIDAIIGVA